MSVRPTEPAGQRIAGHPDGLQDGRAAPAGTDATIWLTRASDRRYEGQRPTTDRGWVCSKTVATRMIRVSGERP